MNENMNFQKKIYIFSLLVAICVIPNLAHNNFRGDSSCSDGKSLEERFRFTGNLDTKFVEISKGKKLQIQGNVIKLSQIHFPQCAGRVRFIEIFASEKVLIDKDLNLTGWEMQVAIIAPVWNVEGDRRIILDGQNAEALDDDTANHGTKDGNKYGAHGLAGLPGGPAGSFYGVADEIVYGGQLIISAVGGNGGKGQNGGNGAEGDLGEALKDGNLFSCRKGKADGYPEVTGPKYDINIYTGSRTPEYYVKGTEGKPGGRGGNGGAGGLGGFAGTISLIELSKRKTKSLKEITEREGNHGEKGQGGQGGLGGWYGNTMRVVCYVFETRSSFFSAGYQRGANGRVGKPGVSLSRHEMPKKALMVQNFQQTINQYKDYIRPKVVAAKKLSSLPEPIIAFYESINNHKEITVRYDTLSIVEEFEGLERQVFYLREKEKFISSYKSLENRIISYGKKPNFEKENATQYINIIEKLTMDISHKLDKLNEGKPYSVVTDIKEELQHVLKWKTKLEDQDRVENILKTLGNKMAIVNNLIEEADLLINVELKAKMREVETTLDEEIDNLLQEISELKKKNLSKEDELIESRRKLTDIMELKFVFGALKIGAGLVSAVYPALGVAASVASTTLPIAEKYTTNNKLPTNVAELPKTVRKLRTSSENFVQENGKTNRTEKNLEQDDKFLLDMKKKVSKYGKDLIDKTLSFIKGKKEKGQSVGIYETREGQINTELKKAEEEKNSEKINDCKIGKRVVQYLKASDGFKQTASDTYANIMKDNSKIDEINLALEKIRNNRKKLQLFEETVYKDTMPMLNEMANFMDKTTESMSGMNENQLLITKWSVDSTMNDVQHKLSETLNSFKMGDDLKWTLDKLISTFDKTIEMHQKIVEYGQRKDNDKFLSDLFNAEEPVLLASDSHLTAALARLKKASLENYLLDSYEEFLNAFKQYAFPYSGKELTNTLWLDTYTKENTSHFIAVMKNNIEQFNQLLFMNNYHKILELQTRTADFLGSFGSTREAFFVWTNETSGGFIRDILSGKETKLSAYVRQNDPDVIKFNQVEILFSSENREIQQKLNEVLRHFVVTLTHHGDSIYKFRNKHFKIQTSPTILEFRLPKTGNKLPDEPSRYYEKVAKGAHMLSPYATWTVKLRNERSIDFKALEEFKGQVDLELVGNGQFLSDYQCDGTCENNVLKYYKD